MFFWNTEGSRSQEQGDGHQCQHSRGQYWAWKGTIGFFLLAVFTRVTSNYSGQSHQVRAAIDYRGGRIFGIYIQCLCPGFNSPCGISDYRVRSLRGSWGADPLRKVFSFDCLSSSVGGHCGWAWLDCYNEAARTRWLQPSVPLLNFWISDRVKRWLLLSHFSRVRLCATP